VGPRLHGAAALPAVVVNGVRCPRYA